MVSGLVSLLTVVPLPSALNSKRFAGSCVNLTANDTPSAQPRPSRVRRPLVVHYGQDLRDERHQAIH